MKRTHLAGLTAILLAAFLLRIAALGAQPLSGDEAFTVTQWGPASITELLNDIAKKDPQPPVALFTYRTWMQLAGSSELAVRFIGACFSLITVAAVFALARRILPKQAAIVAAFLCAIAPFQIWYAQDARPYAEWMALTSLAAVTLLHALPQKRFLPWLLYTILAALSLQTFYLEVFAAASAGLYALYHFIHTRKFNSAWLLSQIAVALTFLPWLIYSKPQSNPYQPTAGFPDIPGSLTELIFNNTLPPTLTSRLISTASISLLQLYILMLAIYAIYTLVRSKLSQQKYLIIIQLGLPILLLTALSLVTQKAFFRTRYIAAASAPLLILISALPFARPNGSKHKLITALFILPILPVSLISLAEYRFDPAFAKAPPWREISALLHRDALPNDIVIQNYPDPAFTYYYAGPAPTVILPSKENPPPEDTIAQLNQLPASHEHIWFIRVDTPYWDKQQVVANWLAGNTAYVSDTWIEGMRLYQYAAWDTTPAYVRNKLDINLGLAVLTGYRITTTEPRPGAPQTIALELFWLPQQRTNTDLRVFVHLITNSPDGTIKLWSQDDHPPQQGRLATSSWPTAGSVFRDVYQIPLQPSMPPGQYQIAAGFYDPTTSTRYTIPSIHKQPEPNAILVTNFTLPGPK